MKYRLVQYIQPWEIDDFERVTNQLIKSAYTIPNPKEISFGDSIMFVYTNKTFIKIGVRSYLKAYRANFSIEGINFSHLNFSTLFLAFFSIFS